MRSKLFSKGLFIFILFFSLEMDGQDKNQWMTYEGQSGPGKGKHIVLISGDEEYRSEEALPLLAKLLAAYHGFACTVLFAIDSATGNVDPNILNNIPGLHLLKTADLVVMSLRFRELPDDQMKFIDQYLQEGKPIVALRTSTHAFRYKINKTSRYAKYGTDSKVKGWEGGFGKKVLGETWVSHHGNHGVEGTRGLNNGIQQAHPILKGVKDVWGYTDVYTVGNLGVGTQVLQYGLSIQGMTPTALPNYEKSVMPVSWIRNYKAESGKTCRIFTTTMGASVDLESEGLRRLLINACYWGMNMEDKISEQSNVQIIGNYKPTMFGFNAGLKGLKPVDF
ncbi:MAG: ThuA domain-containing protein [Saprospiraceae bacterium]|nr:ThuA domain-containing protein [Saprospiraceae bacterium]